MAATSEAWGRTPDWMRAQLQFNDCGEYAVEVQEWLKRHFNHLHPVAIPTPNLEVQIDVPLDRLDSVGGWRGRLLETSGAMSLLLEILEQCLTEVAVPTCDLLSVHLVAPVTLTSDC